MVSIPSCKDPSNKLRLAARQLMYFLLSRFVVDSSDVRLTAIDSETMLYSPPTERQIRDRAV